MVMYAVAEEDALGVFRESLEFSAFAVSGIVLQDCLEGVAQAEVAGAVLVPEDVAAPFCGLGKVVGVLLLLEGEVFPTGNLVTDDLYVGKLVYGVAEIGIFLAAAGGDECH